MSGLIPSQYNLNHSKGEPLKLNVYEEILKGFENNRLIREKTPFPCIQ